VEAFVDPDQITQVLHNLLQNAVDAAKEAHPEGGGAVSLGIEQRGAIVIIRVADNGSGIPADRVDAIFDPYYTRKSGGTGLGLAITQRIIAEHGGRIEVTSRPGQTVFSVFVEGRSE
jgi:signal transduction histidine kinase